MESSILERVNQTEFVGVRHYENPTWWKGLLAPEELDLHEKMAWGKEGWTWSIYAAIAYLILIFAGQEVMKNRKPYNLKIPMAIWNLGLAAFSIKGSSVLISHIWNSLAVRGFHDSICGTLDISNQESNYWGYLFVLSKMVELGDTAFIVLRKRKLIFLHWYHHISVLICVWLSSKDLMSTGAWFALVNYSVHAIMYTYYGLMSLGIRLPKKIAMSITMSQISQMVVGVTINAYALKTKLAGSPCTVMDSHIWLVFGMYLSYLVLFGNFFYKAYVLKETPNGRNGKRKAN